MRKPIFILFFCYATTLQAAIIIPPIIVKKPVSYAHNASVNFISREDIKTSGVANLSQALQELGALELHDSSGNSSAAAISMRGFGANASSNTLILINGVPLTNPDLASPDLNLIPLQDIQLIEIISGSQSVTYGDQAVGGVVNIITSAKLAHQITAACSIGSYDAAQCYANLNATYRNWFYSVNGLNSHTNNYRDHNAYDQHRLFGTIANQYSNGKINIDYAIANEKLLYPGALTHEQVVEDRRQSNNDTDYFQNWNGYLHLQQEQTLNNQWQVHTDVARRDMHGNGVLFSPFTQSRGISFLRSELQGKYSLATFNSGIDFENDNYHLGSAFGTTQDKQNKFGVFGLTDFNLRPNVILNLGIRGALQNNQLTSYNQFNSLNRALATTIGVKYILNPCLNLYVTRAENFRFPKADEDADVEPGVKYLKTQRGVSYEAGVMSSTAKSNWNAEIYRLQLRDEIAFDPFQTPARPFGTNRNLDPTLRYGLLLSEKFVLTNLTTIGFHYNYVNARFQFGRFAGNRIPLVAENIFRADIRYQFHEHWNIFAEGVYTGNEYPDNDDANITGKIGGYVIYNANIGYRCKDISIMFRVNNIFDKKYYSYTVYQPSLATNYFYPAPERSYSLEFKFMLL